MQLKWGRGTMESVSLRRDIIKWINLTICLPSNLKS